MATSSLPPPTDEVAWRWLPQHFGWALFGITVVAGLIRLAAIDVQSFWYDEAYTDAVLARATWADLLFGRAGDDGNPPLFYLVTGPVSWVLGRSEAAYRLPSVVWGTLAVTLLGVVGRMLFSPRVALAAAGLLAISPFAVEVSAEARTYPLLHLLVLANLWALVQWFETGRNRWLALYALTMTLACYAHYYALLLPVIHLLALAWAGANPRRIGVWFLAMVLVAAAGLIWLPAFLDQFALPGNLSRMGDRWPWQFLATPLVYGAGRTLVWRSSDMAALVLVSLAVVATLWAPALWGLVQLRRRPFACSLLAGYWLLPIGVPLVMAIGGMPLYTVRYASVGLPPFLLLAAFGLSRIAPRVRWPLAGCLLLLSVASLVAYFTRPLNDNWRDATRLLVDQLGDAPWVLVDKDIQTISLLYYANRYERVPAALFGVTEPIEADRLVGEVYRDGSLVDQPPTNFRDHAAEVTSFWVVTCVPHNSSDEYAAFFGPLGFEPAEQFACHRVQLTRFVSIRRR